MGVLVAGGLTGLLNQSSAQMVDGSLKFDSGSSDHLIRTPSSAGNRKTWTWSGWVKRSKIERCILFCGSAAGGNTVGTVLRFSYQDQQVELYDYVGGYTFQTYSEAFLRDPSSWYHIVVAFDTTQSTNTDRVKFYINGALQANATSGYNGASTYPAQNADCGVSNNTPQLLGLGWFADAISTSQQYDGSMSQVYLIDGLALGPGYFGFTDPLTNTWRPKKYEGTFTQSVNDGTTWSSGTVTGTAANASGSGGWAQAFDGSTSTLVYPTDNNGSTEIVLPKTIAWTSKIRIYAGQNGTSGTNIIANGVNLSALHTWPLAGGWQEVTSSLSSPLASLKLLNVGGQASNIRAVEIDDIVLIDGLTNTGVNSFYLPMDNDDFNIDKSGNGNNWTKQNFSGTSIDPDVLKDSPSGAVFGGRAQTGITTTSSAPSNYATWNPLFGENQSLSNGNLKAASSASDYAIIASTISMKNGKWYMEYTYTPNNGQPYITWGISQTNRNGTEGSGVSDTPEDKGFKAWDSGFYSQSDGSNIYNYSSSVSSGDIISLAFDADAGNLWVAKNGTYMTNASGAGNPTAGTNPDYSGLDYSGGYYFMAGPYYTNGSTLEANFGQKPFKYAPPQGFLPLNSASATPETVITRPDQYVGVTTYTGENNTRDIETGLSPDLVWIKKRNNTKNHVLFDSVRGIRNGLYSNDTDAEGDFSGGVLGFNRSSFQISNSDFVNGSSSNTYVAWCWKAGGSKNTFNVDDVGYASAAAAGLIAGTDPSTDVLGASVGTKQGFSIIKYNNSDGGTYEIPHGLTQTPNILISKKTSGSENWYVHTNAIDGTVDYAHLNLTNSFNDSSRTLTSTTVPMINSSGDFIAYIWHDVPGLQKFGSYVGTGFSDNRAPFIYLGFRPRLIWIKSTTLSHNWVVFDSERGVINPVDEMLFLNESNSEAAVDSGDTNTGDLDFDILSNGLKFRTANWSVNKGSSDTYIYCAWAEAPTFNLYGAQSNAR